MNSINGAEAIAIDTNVSPQANPDVVLQLEAALKAAKAGEIFSFAAIAVNRAGGMTPILVGPALPHLYTGLDIVQGIILQHMTNPQNQSRIIRAQGM